MLQQQHLKYVLCHADIHGWNLLITADDALYIVDWDTLIFAPKERDLMFIGAGIGDTRRTLFDEEQLFYSGYGQEEINHDAIAYYRFEHIIEDSVSPIFESILAKTKDIRCWLLKKLLKCGKFKCRTRKLRSMSFDIDFSLKAAKAFAWMDSLAPFYDFFGVEYLCHTCQDIASF